MCGMNNAFSLSSVRVNRFFHNDNWNWELTPPALAGGVFFITETSIPFFALVSGDLFLNSRSWIPC